MNQFLRFSPLYFERIWGGREIETHLGRELPARKRIGESWELVDRPEAVSVAVDGPFAGRSLREILKSHGRDIMGETWKPERPFPILVKWLDARERLSLQVHPSAAAAPAFGGEPKTENWFIAKVAPGAAVLVGLKPKTSKEEFKRAMLTNQTERCVNRLTVRAGDSILVHSGTIHAIDAGCLILEIQQNSDTTFRVDDWGRVGVDGKPRQLHVKESLECIVWDENRTRLAPSANVRGVIADCAEFRIRREPLAAGATLVFNSGDQPRLLHVVSGGVTSEAGAVRASETVLLPISGRFEFRAEENSMLLVTENFI